MSPVAASATTTVSPDSSQAGGRTKTAIDDAGALGPQAHVRSTCSTCFTVVMKRNLTIQLDEDLIRRAKVIAAERGTSVSGLVAQQITELIAARDRYARARESALQMMSEAIDRGGRHWTREELYEERHSRYGA